jgi:hypothetical protein
MCTRKTISSNLTGVSALFQESSKGPKSCGSARFEILSYKRGDHEFKSEPLFEYQQSWFAPSVEPAIREAKLLALESAGELLVATSPA